MLFFLQIVHKHMHSSHCMHHVCAGHMLQQLFVEGHRPEVHAVYRIVVDSTSHVFKSPLQLLLPDVISSKLYGVVVQEGFEGDQEYISKLTGKLWCYRKELERLLPKDARRHDLAQYGFVQPLRDDADRASSAAAPVTFKVSSCMSFKLFRACKKLCVLLVTRHFCANPGAVPWYLCTTQGIIPAISWKPGCVQNSPPCFQRPDLHAERRVRSGNV